MAEPVLHEPASRKRCRVCGDVKPLPAFAKHRHRRDGRDSACKLCVAEKGRKWYRERQLSTDGLYSTYVSMKGRCHNERHQNYRLYGGRGIRVCEEWQESFDVFLSWVCNWSVVGLRPVGPARRRSARTWASRPPGPPNGRGPSACGSVFASGSCEPSGPPLPSIAVRTRSSLGPPRGVRLGRRTSWPAGGTRP